MTSFSDLLDLELKGIPLEHWGFFFPCHVAAWRFIRERRPDLLGEIDCGYDHEPWFKGKGATWFLSSVVKDSEYLEGVEGIMYPLATKLVSKGRLGGGRLDGDEALRHSIEKVERALERLITRGA
jgi:hypothetical protein